MRSSPASSTMTTAARRSRPARSRRRAARPRRPSASIATGQALRRRWFCPTGTGVDSRRTSSDGRTWSQIDTIRDPQGTVIGTQTTTFDGTSVTQTWEPANGLAQTASWEAEPSSGEVHLANAGIGALGGLGTAGSMAADSLTATAKAIAGDMLALGARALGLAGSAVAGVAAGAAVLLTPTNSQGTTVDLGDGVRLRQPPGDSSGVIEKSVPAATCGTARGSGAYPRWSHLGSPADIDDRRHGAGEGDRAGGSRPRAGRGRGRASMSCRSIRAVRR